ncbi:MAG: GNAT family N-acetyltransferase [Bacteroidia bacterium]
MSIVKEKPVILTAADKAAWDACFNSLPAALRDINYSYDYHMMYQSNGDGEIRLFYYERDKEKFFYPYLQRRIFVGGNASPYNDIESAYGYTGPLSTTTDDNFLREADEEFRRHCKEENIVTEFIRFNPLLSNETVFHSSETMDVIPLRDYVTVELTSSAEELFLGFSPQNRNKIRKAEKTGVQIRFDREATDFDSFVSIYLENMRRLNAAKMYFFSDSFFKSLKQLVQQNGTFCTAMLDGKIIGATVFLRGETIAHYFLSSADEEGKKNAVSNLMLHHGIQWAKKQGLEQMHLGGGVTGAADDPLLVFKQNFSEKTVRYCIGKRIHNSRVYEALIKQWEEQYPDKAVQYKPILQRYRLTKEDMQ